MWSYDVAVRRTGSVIIGSQKYLLSQHLLNSRNLLVLTDPIQKTAL